MPIVISKKLLNFIYICIKYYTNIIILLRIDPDKLATS